MPPVNGLHHVTALAGDPQQNLHFYSGVLGLRLVKKTVNFDDPSSYHLFYGDETGAPGTIISFFASPHFTAGSPDTGQPVAVSFSIPSSSVDYWIAYLSENDIAAVEPFERFGQPVIGLQGPDGLHLELIGDAFTGETNTPSQSAVPSQHAIRGLHGITITEENYRATGQLLTESLGFDEMDEAYDRILYQTDAPHGHTIEVIDGAKLNGKPGKGTVHHLAFRAANRAHLNATAKRLKKIGYHLTDVEDRRYFKSVFFHEPGGALLGIATDKPGFTVDEKPEMLGSNLCLPPELKEKRSLIEAELPDLH